MTSDGKLTFWMTVASGVVTAAGVLWKLITFGYRTARKIDDTFTYVDALKTNHIPYLTRVVEELAHRQGIDLVQMEKEAHPAKD